jgi:phospholipid/cholesterol/gamma-HCH transport system substrate-binding protein
MERKGLELGVGLFLLLGLLCLGYLSIKLGNVHIFKSSDYKVQATFSNVGGLKPLADITMAGVQIGRVESVQLKNGQALVTLNIHKDVALEEDVIASIKTMGIIGDKYISISPGASDDYIQPGGKIRDTQPPLDIEKLVGKFVFGSVEKAATPNGSGKPERLDKTDQLDQPDKLDREDTFDRKNTPDQANKLDPADALDKAEKPTPGLSDPLSEGESDKTGPK